MAGRVARMERARYGVLTSRFSVALAHVAKPDPVKRSHTPPVNTFDHPVSVVSLSCVVSFIAGVVFVVMLVWTGRLTMARAIPSYCFVVALVSSNTSVSF